MASSGLDWESRTEAKVWYTSGSEGSVSNAVFRSSSHRFSASSSKL